MTTKSFEHRIHIFFYYIYKKEFRYEPLLLKDWFFMRRMSWGLSTCYPSYFYFQTADFLMKLVHATNCAFDCTLPVRFMHMKVYMHMKNLCTLLYKFIFRDVNDGKILEF